MKAGRPTGISWVAGENVVVTRARRRIGLLVGVAVTVLVTLVGVVAYGMLVRGQESQIRRELAYAAEHGDPSGPPGCTWLIVLRDGKQITGRDPLPPGFPLTGALTTVATTRTAHTSRVNRNGTEYVVLTRPRGEETVQVIFDTRYQRADRHHLLLALAAAELAGLLAALASGMIVGRRAVAPLAEALARQRRFIAEVSHELRTPIAQVHTRAQVLARRAVNAGVPADYRTELDRLIGTTRRLGEVVDDLLLSARLAALPHDRPAADPVDLAALAEVAVIAETDRATEQGVTITLRRPDEPLRVTGVASALRRVVGELLANALSHTPGDGRIEVVVRRDGGVIELTVTDTGTGFDPTDRIFDPFHSGIGGRRHTGLGLALLREVVTGHGGTIEARGRPGRGASFAVRLPADVAQALPVAQVSG